MWQLAFVSGEAATRRLVQLSGVLGSKPRLKTICTRSVSSTTTPCQDGGKIVKIGDVSLKIRPAKNPEYVPKKYLPEHELPQSILQHLRWILQKDALGQDVFLLGPPGPFRRQLAMMYLEMTGKELEYVSLSRDTTEADLKQRREIRGGTATHVDQSAVQAAIGGRVLVLEGIEKAERNVLPVLNNLLENREMQLDDGRFLMAAARYDALLAEHSQTELDAWQLVRVSEDFRVIALGLPVPRYQGNPLDPPLRSRFQARNIPPLQHNDHLDVLHAVSSGVPPDTLATIMSFAATLRSKEASSLGLPDFPVDNLNKIVKILSTAPHVDPWRLLQRLYPARLMLGKEGQAAVNDALKHVGMTSSDSKGSSINEVSLTNDNAEVILQDGWGKQSKFTVARGTLTHPVHTQEFVSTPYHSELLADLVQSHMVGDFCVIGGRGCGKSILVKQFAEMLGYHTETIMMYQDMTSRDLLQQRTTLSSGDTAWRPSLLVTAAMQGSIAIVDGLHRVNAGTLAVLHRLVHDRELSLYDGTRLLSQHKYEAIKQEQALTDAAMKERGILPIHPSFRMIALSEPPAVGSSSGQWLSPELLSMFLYHDMRPLSRNEEENVLHRLVPNMADMTSVINLTHRLRNSTDAALVSVAGSLSTRQLVRLARRLSHHPDENRYSLIHKACLAQFLPRLARNALEEEMAKEGMLPPPPPQSVSGLEHAMSCQTQDGVLRIGNTSVDVYNTADKMKVPDVLFYENAGHLAVMEDMLKDFSLGEHILLVGNQGVGKNKVIDRFLSLLNRPREYLQLHRDTTVQTLTVKPSVVGGVLTYEDSPLVAAVKHGYVLVVDEADKAPTNVTCILKTLVEAGEMMLADGRRIVPAGSAVPQHDPSIIQTHPDFRMVVLANRPGFPFLGNDFFGAMGDIFSCHAVDNPDVQSELSMLRQYGPDVPEATLSKLVLAFSDLRDMADQGQIQYPYSTREVVNMVRHLQAFPDEGLSSVVRNVFDFDSYNSDLKESIITTLHKHGIPVGADPSNISLAKQYSLPSYQKLGSMQIKGTDSHTCTVVNKQLNIKGPVPLPIQSHPLGRNEARSLLFTEQEAYWSLPLHETAAIADITVTKSVFQDGVAGLGARRSDVIHVATVSPVSLYSMDPKSQNVTCIDLNEIFPDTGYGSPARRLRLAPLGSPLDNHVLLHDESTHMILDIDTKTGELRRIVSGSILQNTSEKFSRQFGRVKPAYRMCEDFSHKSGVTLFYKLGESSIDVMNIGQGTCTTVQLPVGVSEVHMLSESEWLIQGSESAQRYILSDQLGSYTLQTIQGFRLGDVDMSSTVSLSDPLLSQALGKSIQSPNRVLAPRQHLPMIAVGMPDMSTISLHGILRESLEEEEAKHLKKVMDFHAQPSAEGRRSRQPVVFMPTSGQVVRAVPSNVAPVEALPEGVKAHKLSGFLEVTDLADRKIRYIPIPGLTNTQIYNQWYNSGQDVGVVMSRLSGDGLVTVDNSGGVRLWQTAMSSLSDAVAEWRGLIGEHGVGDRKLQMTYEKELGKQATEPKHGKVDEKGTPHVGGNTWAGGTGGRDTAGLGGIGGPYRLDAGHDVTQVPDWEKEAVPDEVKKAARAMGLKAWKDKLQDIKMGEYDGKLYEKFSKGVSRQVTSFRIILDNLQAKGAERQWLRHQTQGDLDDGKLIEGITGEKTIYKRRGDREPELGSPQQKPKMVTLAVDVSGSMYRFNGYDGRLEREMEAMVMVMESLSGYEHKIRYRIVGHSGEGPSFPVVEPGKPPANDKDRLNVVKELHAHSQFCLSGDNTVEAARAAINHIAKETEVDEKFVILLSDANLDRYGISPRRLGSTLTANDDVNAYVIFIGSLGNQAATLQKQLPAGHAFVCMDTKDLPHILQQIFTSTITAR